MEDLEVLGELEELEDLEELEELEELKMCGGFVYSRVGVWSLGVLVVSWRCVNDVVVEGSDFPSSLFNRAFMMASKLSCNGADQSNKWIPHPQNRGRATSMCIPSIVVVG